jgi:hypothetical protein
VFGIVVVGLETGMRGEAGAVVGSGVEDDAGRVESICGDGEGAHVPAGVSDKEETVFEKGTTMKGVSGEIEE